MAELTQSLRIDLISTMPIEQVFQKHVIDGSSYIFNRLLNERNWEYELRYEFASQLGVNINDIVIVGSAKLGFSLKTHELVSFDDRYMKSGNPRDRSDVDVAVINRNFYDNATRQIYELSRHYDPGWIKDNWKTNRFNKFPGNLFSRYSEYLAKGWLRPDLIPLAFYDAANWPTVCDKWYKKLNARRINVGFYSDWFYLKHYQMDNLLELKLKIRNLEIS